MDRPQISRGLTDSKRAPHLKHIVITGGANGIGKALAEAYCKEVPVTVTIIDRDEEAAKVLCQQLSSGQAQVNFIRADLSDSSSIPTIVKALSFLPPIDILAFNAGINRASPFLKNDRHILNDIITINFLSPLLLSHALLAQDMIAKDGTFVFVSSLSVFSSYPGAAVYAGSKDGLHAFANSLREIIKPRKIKVLIVYPGPTETEQARSNSPLQRRGGRRMLPAVLAEKIVNAIAMEHRWLIPGANNICISLLGRIFPSAMQAMMRRVIFEKIVNK